MPETPLLLTTDGPVRVLTINRPARRNAMDRATMSALRAHLSAVGADAAARVLVITGAGTAFVAGADITEFQGLTAAEARAFAIEGQQVLRRLETLGRPTIAAINGFALGGGCELALACTFRLMAEGARIGLPEVKLGLIPGFGGTQRLARLVGRERALDWILTGRQVEADEAVTAGFAMRAVPADRLMAEALGLAHQLAAGASLAQSYALAAVDQGLDVGLDAGCAIEATLFGLAASSEDMREGVAAFLDKRPPSFTGR
jgi:enoyl-CoA hydratase